MNPFVITVEFRLLPGCLGDFLKLVRENSRRSLAEELGCRRFDVLSADHGVRVLLYEIYDDECAFDVHCQTPHFLDFDKASRNLYEAKIVQRYTLIQDAKAEAVA